MGSSSKQQRLIVPPRLECREKNEGADSRPVASKNKGRKPDLAISALAGEMNENNYYKMLNSLEEGLIRSKKSLDISDSQPFTELA